jgi:hypothetical protein
VTFNPQPIFQIKNWREWLWTFSDLFFKPLKNQRRFDAKKNDPYGSTISMGEMLDFFPPF